MTADEHAKTLWKLADDLCYAWERAERAGCTVELRLDWEYGLTPTLQPVKCRTAYVEVNGVEVLTAFT